MKKEELYKVTDILNDVLANYLRGSEAEEVIAKVEDTIEKLGLLKEEPVREDFETEWKCYCDAKGGGAITVNVKELARHFAAWQKEQIEKVLLSEVLPCFMHGGEADEVVAKLDEVLNQKK